MKHRNSENPLKKTKLNSDSENLAPNKINQLSLKVFFKKTCSTYTNKDPNDLQSELQEDSLFIATSTALKNKRKHEDFHQNNLNYEKFERRFNLQYSRNIQ